MTQTTLIPETPPSYDERTIKLKDITVNDGIEPSRSMIDSVERFGIIHPILVRKATKRYVVIDGRRRVAAAKALDLDAIPARVVKEGNGVLPPALTLQANTQRSSNPVAELEAIERLIEKEGYTESEIASALGISVQTIRKRLRLTNLVGDLYDEWKAGRVSTSVAEAAAKLDTKRQAQLVKVIEKDGKLTRSAVTDIKKVQSEKASAALPDEMFESAPKIVAVAVDDLRLVLDSTKEGTEAWLDARQRIESVIEEGEGE